MMTIMCPIFLLFDEWFNYVNTNHPVLACIGGLLNGAIGLLLIDKIITYSWKKYTEE